YRFFRENQDVTVVAGRADYSAAVTRLTEILKPWGIRLKILALDEASKPRSVTPEEAATWVGMHPGKVAPGDKGSPSQVGLAVQGPVLLLGTPEDNGLLKFAHDNGFLPYAPHRSDFPGRGRGMIAWQRDCVGLNQESVALIAYDPEGISEAVGTLYEFAAGLEPPLPPRPPALAAVTPAKDPPAQRARPPLARQVAPPQRARAP